MEDELGQGQSNLFVVFSGGGTTVDDLGFQTAVEEALEPLAQDATVAGVATFYTTGSPAFVSEDRTKTFAVVGLVHDADAASEDFPRLRALLFSEELEINVTGEPAAAREIQDKAESDLQRAELFAFPIVAILLVLILGSLVAASLPQAMGVLSVVAALLGLRILTEVTDVSVFALNITILLGLGLSIDYAFLIVDRFRKELRTKDVPEALQTTMSTAGKAVAFSGLAVAISLLGLLFFPMNFLQSMGLGGALVTGLAAIGALTVLPAILGPKVNALSVLRQDPGKEGVGFWYRLSTGVMKRPIVVMVPVVAFLVLLASPALDLRLGSPDPSILPSGNEIRWASEQLENDFAPGESTPINVVVQARGDILQPDNLLALDQLARDIAATPGVSRIDGLANVSPESIDSLAPRFASGDFTWLSVISGLDRNSDEAQNLVKVIRGIAPANGLEILVGGETAQLVDTKGSLYDNIPWALAFVFGVTFIVLFLMFGSVVLPLKAVIMNALSIGATFGILVWIFQWGNLSGPLNFEPSGFLISALPMLLFGVVFGLSMDYEVFLLSRVKEEHDRTGDNAQAVAKGLQHTGRIITSAALLFIVLTGAFATADIVIIKSLGVGMAIAIALDATIVRALLVPATMRLMGDYNWWAPRPLKWLWDRIGIQETEGPPTPALVPAVVADND
ncbi:MAG TPA: MMPL family transporter [Dehalococcoidia bacterium]|nr:MMPL family transporter [Dehalococcoidia bacterium]